jgi:hypothetical protein
VALDASSEDRLDYSSAPSILILPMLLGLRRLIVYFRHIQPQCIEFIWCRIDSIVKRGVWNVYGFVRGFGTDFILRLYETKLVSAPGTVLRSRLGYLERSWNQLDAEIKTENLPKGTDGIRKWYRLRPSAVDRWA